LVSDFAGLVSERVGCRHVVVAYGRFLCLLAVLPLQPLTPARDTALSIIAGVRETAKQFAPSFRLYCFQTFFIHLASQPRPSRRETYQEKRWIAHSGATNQQRVHPTKASRATERTETDMYRHSPASSTTTSTSHPTQKATRRTRPTLTQSHTNAGDSQLPPRTCGHQARSPLTPLPLAVCLGWPGRGTRAHVWTGRTWSPEWAPMAFSIL
jgi:hypothetical protein